MIEQSDWSTIVAGLTFLVVVFVLLVGSLLMFYIPGRRHG